MDLYDAHEGDLSPEHIADFRDSCVEMYDASYLTISVIEFTSFLFNHMPGTCFGNCFIVVHANQSWLLVFPLVR